MGQHAMSPLFLAILWIAGLAILFFVCSLLCYCICSYLLQEDGKDVKKPPIEVWNQKHYYDPLPTALSPPEVLCHPSAYSFKIQNGTNHHVQPHAVINPAVLQYPPGHVLENRHIIPLSFGPQSKGDRSSSKISPKSDFPHPEPHCEDVLQVEKIIGNGQVL